MPSAPPAGTDDDTWLLLSGKSLAELQAAAIERATRRNGGSSPAAATELEISRATVLKQLGATP